jgi:hypothetical protein
MAFRGEHHELAFNSHNDKPILLVPKRLLDHLPMLSGEDWIKHHEQNSAADRRIYIKDDGYFREWRLLHGAGQASRAASTRHRPEVLATLFGAPAPHGGTQ